MSIETQTEPEPIEAMTQTTREAESQTKALPKEKAVQTSKDLESQTVEVEMTLEQEDKFIMTTFLFAISMLVKHAKNHWS